MRYTATRGRIDGDVHDVLSRWLPPRVAPDGYADFRISEFSAPNAGYSGKTVFFTASWVGPDGAAASIDLVLRMQAADHQLFLTPEAVRQAEVMRRLGRHPGVTTPAIVATERDAEILGAPFYVMERVSGRIPSDVPSWHKKGWTVELAASDRERLYDNALRSLVALHRIDDADDVAALATPGAGTALTRYLDHVRRWYDGISAALVVGTDVLAAAAAELRDHPPATAAEGIVWGDARVGNICFAEDLSVAALFDWEGATTGPPDIDLGWWLMFERYLCESLGLTRPPGVPDDDEIVRRYRQFGGQPTGDLVFYQLLAAFVLALITNRLATLLVRDGLDPDIARTYPAAAVDLAQRYLEQRIEQRTMTP